MIPQLPGYLFDLSWAGFFSFVLAFILPLLAALLVKASYPSSTKGVILLVLSVAKAFIESFIAQGSDFDFGRTAYAVLLNFGIALIAYFGLLRGTGVQQAAINTGNVDKQPQ